MMARNANQAIRQLCWLLLALSTHIAVCDAYRLLFMPLSERTHILVHLKVASVLAQRGHEVAFTTPACHLEFAKEALKQMAPAAELSFLPYSMNCTYHEHEKAAARLLSPLGEVKAIYGNVVGRADDMLSDAALMQQLAQLAPHTDLLVSDIFSFGMLFAASLNLSHIDVDVGTSGFLWEPVLYGADPAVSYVPATGTFFPTRGMNLWQRASNAAVMAVIRALIRVAFWHPWSKLQRVVAKHSIPIGWPYTQALLVLVNSNFALEPPRAVPPNVQYVGPVLPEPAQALPHDLEQFVTAAGDAGAVLVSFGGTLQAPIAASQALVAAMAALQPVRFVWKLSASEQEVLSATTNLTQLDNVYVSSWLPQNDLLGHPNVRAFVTQGGYLSMGEAAYHGVPILGMPFIPGQSELIRSAVDHGRGLYVSTQQLAAGDVAVLVRSLQQLMTQDSFRAAAQVVSRRLKAVKHPYKEQAADWVEFAAAVKADGPFLHPQKVEQHCCQQAMLDVLLLYVLAAAAVCLLSRQLWRQLQAAGRRLRGSGTPLARWQWLPKLLGGDRAGSGSSSCSSNSSRTKGRSTRGGRHKGAGAPAVVATVALKPMSAMSKGL